MSWKSRAFALLAAGALSPASFAEGTVYPAVATTSCGSSEGGAYHVTFVTEHDEVLIYADNLRDDPWVGKIGDYGPRLTVLACDASRSKCFATQEAELTINRRPRDRIEGTLSYSDSDGDKHAVRFAAKLQWFGEKGFCG